MAFKMRYQGGDSPWKKSWWKKVFSKDNAYGRGDGRGKRKLTDSELNKLGKGNQRRGESFSDFKKRMGVG